jgi:hypothetical protein
MVLLWFVAAIVALSWPSAAPAKRVVEAVAAKRVAEEVAVGRMPRRVLKRTLRQVLKSQW